MKMQDETPVVKCYGSQYWHDDVMIIGNRSGLQRLRSAIDQALLIGREQSVEANLFEADGEGYTAYIKVLEWDFGDKRWGKLPLHYYDEVAGDIDPAKWKNVGKVIRKEK